MYRRSLHTIHIDKLIGTTFIGADGRRYKYTRKLNSSRKTDFNVTLTKTQYFKLEYVPVDDDLNPLPDAVPQTAVSAKTDFLKKTEVSVNLMAHIVYLWIRLKVTANFLPPRIFNSKLLQYPKAKVI